jgi:DNA-directed RNA polymerase specialized sigma24 family protein
MTSRAGRGHGRPDPGLDAVMSERRQLINLAYRMLGSLAEAEDAVQETYARWYAMSARQREAVENPGAWLAKVASRKCLNLLGSARARRETYVGAWLPEPLPDPVEWPSGAPGAAADPADRVTLDESVSMAFLVVLGAMTPAERVAFVLHDVFGYPRSRSRPTCGNGRPCSRSWTISHPSGYSDRGPILAAERGLGAERRCAHTRQASPLPRPVTPLRLSAESGSVRNVPRPGTLCARRSRTRRSMARRTVPRARCVSAVSSVSDGRA